MIKLNLGCGVDYRDGWVNVDKGYAPCDVKHDIEQCPWPWEDDSVDEVSLKHVLEHVEKECLPNIVRELGRVCRNGAIITVESPYALSDNFMTDPTHKLPITQRTLEYFDKSKPLGVNGAIYGWPQCLSIQTAMLRSNPPYGPDVVIVAKVVK